MHVFEDIYLFLNQRIKKNKFDILNNLQYNYLTTQLL